MIIAQQLEPYIRSITALMERISPKLQVLATGYWLLATGYWVLATGYWCYWVLGTGVTGYWVLATGVACGTGYRVLVLLVLLLTDVTGVTEYWILVVVLLVTGYPPPTGPRHTPAHVLTDLHAREQGA